MNIAPVAISACGIRILILGAGIALSAGASAQDVDTWGRLSPLNFSADSICDTPGEHPGHSGEQGMDVSALWRSAYRAVVPKKSPQMATEPASNNPAADREMKWGLRLNRSRVLLTIGRKW